MSTMINWRLGIFFIIAAIIGLLIFHNSYKKPDIFYLVQIDNCRFPPPYLSTTRSIEDKSLKMFLTDHSRLTITIVNKSSLPLDNLSIRTIFPGLVSLPNQAQDGSSFWQDGLKRIPIPSIPADNHEVITLWSNTILSDPDDKYKIDVIAGNSKLELLPELPAKGGIPYWIIENINLVAFIFTPLIIALILGMGIFIGNSTAMNQIFRR